MPVGKLFMMNTSAPARATLLTIKALNLDVEMCEVNLLKNEHLDPKYVKENPQHTVPFYVDQDGSKIWDSHAINAYLVSKYGKTDELYPKDLFRRAVVDQRLHFDSGSLFPYGRQIMVGITQKGWTSMPEALIKNIRTSYEFLNKFLEGQQWFAGDTVTIADYSILTSVTFLDYFVPLEDQYPLISTWLTKCQEWSYYSAHTEGFKVLTSLLGSMSTIKV